MSTQLAEKNNVSKKGTSKTSTKIKLIIFLVIVVVILSLILGIVIVKHSANKYKAEAAEAKAEVQELLDKAVLLEKVSKTITTEELKSEMKKIGELATIEYIYTDASKFEDNNQLWGINVPLTKKSFIVRWSGTIKAGIELENIKTEIDEDNKKIIIYLPKPKILSHTHDNESFEVLDESNNIFNPIKVEDINTFTSDNDWFIERRAKDKGLIEKADQNAKMIIENSLKSNIKINQNYEIVIKSVSELKEKEDSSNSENNTTGTTATTKTTAG